MIVGDDDVLADKPCGAYAAISPVNGRNQVAEDLDNRRFRHTSVHLSSHSSSKEIGSSWSPIVIGGANRPTWHGPCNRVERSEVWSRFLSWRTGHCQAGERR